MTANPQELLECALQLPSVVAKSCEALPPGVVVIKIAEAMNELAEKLNQG